MIPVTKPFFPPQEEYNKYLDRIWQRNWLTNMGPLASQLKMELKDYVDVNHLLIVENGTVALHMVIKALELRWEMITTPFTFIATTSSIVWEGCQPVFVDIDGESLNIDASKIEAAITDKTSAILATHVYGNPCDVEAIDKIAPKNNLKETYDAAYCFGVKARGKSVFEYGDISTCSLHATMLNHSVEGGLMFTKDSDLLQKLAFIRNFGISGYDSFSKVYLNGKNSEFHAAMGLTNLKWVDRIIEKRRKLTARYENKLKGFKAFRPLWHPHSENNGAYLPFILESEELLLKVKTALDNSEIFTRRYFYPSLSNCLPYLPTTLTIVSDNIAKRTVLTIIL